MPQSSNRRRPTKFRCLCAAAILALPFAGRDLGAQEIRLDTSASAVPAEWGSTGTVLLDDARSANGRAVVLTADGSWVQSPAVGGIKSITFSYAGQPSGAPATLTVEQTCDNVAGYVALSTIPVGAGGLQSYQPHISSLAARPVSCSIRWRNATAGGAAPVYLSGITITPFSAQELAQLRLRAQQDSLLAVALERRLGEVAAELRRQQLSRLSDDVADRVYELASVARSSSGIRATVLGMDVMKSRAQMNDPTKYIGLDSILGQLRGVVNVGVSDYASSLRQKIGAAADRLANAEGSGLLGTIVRIATSSPIGELARTVAVEVARSAVNSRGNAYDFKALGKKWGIDAAEAQTRLTALRDNTSALLQSLEDENKQLVQYASSLDDAAKAAGGTRSQATEHIRILMVGIGYPNDASLDASIAELLDPERQFERNAPQFDAVSAKARERFSTFVPGAATAAAPPQSEQISRADSVLGEWSAKVQDAGYVRQRYDEVVCSVVKLLDVLEADLARTDALEGLPADIRTQRQALAAPALDRLRSQRTSFQQAYGGSRCQEE